MADAPRIKGWTARYGAEVIDRQARLFVTRNRTAHVAALPTDPTDSFVYRDREVVFACDRHLTRERGDLFGSVGFYDAVDIEYVLVRQRKDEGRQPTFDRLCGDCHRAIKALGVDLLAFDTRSDR